MHKNIIFTILSFIIYANQMANGSVLPQNSLRIKNIEAIGKDFIKYNGLPNRGFVDKIHSLNNTLLTDLEKSLYGLRYLKTVELLRARKALLELLSTLDDDLNRKTPKEVLKVHPYNPQVHLLTKQLRETVRNSENNKVNLSSYKNSRNRSLERLSKVSALLSVIDAKIHYLKITIYKENNLKYRRVTKDFGIDKLIASLMGQRAYIFTKYPILGLEIDGLEFYKHIYIDLWGAQYFPRTVIQFAANKNDFTKRVRYNNLESNAPEKTIPLIFEEKLSNSIAHKWKTFSVKKIGKKVRRIFTKALVKSLKANTISLKELNSELKIKDSKNIFDLIAMDESAWEDLEKAFPYVKKEVFINGKKAFKEKKSAEERLMSTKSKNSLYLGGGTIGAAAILGLAGVGAIPVLLVSSLGALFFINDDYKNYTLYKEYQFSAENLFLSGTESFKKQSVEDFIEIKEDYLRSLVFNAMLGTVTIAKPFAIGATRFVLKTSEGLERLSYQTAKTLEKRVRLSKLKYRKLLKSSKRVTTKLSFINKKSSSTKKIQKETLNKFKKLRETQADKFMKKTGNSLKSFISKSKLFKEIASDKLLLQTLGREILVELVAVIIGEYAIRGEKFWEEFHFVMMNTILSVGVISLIAFKGMKQRASMWNAWMAKDYSLFFKRWAIQAKDLAIPTAAVAMAGNTSIEMMIHFQHIHSDDPEHMTIAQRLERSLYMTIFMAGFIGIASSTRSELVYKKANNLIDRGFKKGLTKIAQKNGSMNFLTELIKIPLSFSNNLLGVIAYTKAARDLGLQKNKEITPKDMVQFMHYEKNTDNYSYLFNFSSI